jgi:hypothetical protein
MISPVRSNDRATFAESSVAAADTKRRSPAETRAPAAVVANNPLGNAAEILKPDVVVFGETHKVSPLLRGGNFGLISTKDGQVNYFGAKPTGQTVKLGPLGDASVSVVGSNGAKGDEAGMGLTWKVPTPAGDILMFANARQDAATGGNLIDAIQGKAQGTVTVSMNIGAAYSVSDGAALLLSNTAAPGSGIVAAAALEMAGADAWLGVGYRGSATFENGTLKSLNISGVEIKPEDFGRVFGNAVQQARKSPPLVPNLGSNPTAKTNDAIQVAFGQSPWQVGLSATKRDAQGRIEVNQGTVNILNHGNTVTAVTEPVYELGVKYGALQPGQLITSNAEAGQVIDRVLNQAMSNDKARAAQGQPPAYEYSTAFNRLMNPYKLDFGSKPMQSAYQDYDSSKTQRDLTNASRSLQGLQRLPVQGEQPKPSDYDTVRSVFQGEMRWPKDNPARSDPRPFGL